MKIAIVSKKGGVGKSQVSILLHEAFSQAGKTVYIRDWDPQGTSAKALKKIVGDIPPDRQRTADITILDTPPSLEHTATPTAIREANIVLVVTTPAPADMWEVAEAVEYAREKNPKALIRVVVNKYRKTTLLGRFLDEQLKPVASLVLPIMLQERECYRHSVSMGWRALDSGAREEVLQFAVSLLSLK